MSSSNKRDIKFIFSFLDKFTAPIKGVEATLGRVGSSFDHVHKKISDLHNNLESTVKSFDLIKNSVKNLDHQLSKMGKNFEANHKMATVGRGFSNIKSGVTELGVLSAGIGAAIGIGVEKGAGFGLEFKKATATAGGVSLPDQVELMRAAKNSGYSDFTYEENAKILTGLFQAGFNTTDKKASDALPSVIATAVSGDLSPERAAEVMSDTYDVFQNIFDKDKTMLEKFQRVGDVMSYTSDRATLNMEMMSMAMSEAGSAFSTHGIKLEQAALSIAALASRGYKSTKAGTALKDMLIFASQARIGKRAKERFRDAHIDKSEMPLNDIPKFMEWMKVFEDKTLAFQLKRFKHFGPEKKMRKALNEQEAAIREVLMDEGTTAYNHLKSYGLEKYKEELKNIEEKATGWNLQKNKRMKDGPEGAYAFLKRDAKNIYAELGSTFLNNKSVSPIIKQMSTWSKNILLAMKQTDQERKDNKVLSLPFKSPFLGGLAPDLGIEYASKEAIEFIDGFKKGITEGVEGLSNIFTNHIKPILESFGIGTDATNIGRLIGKFITVFTLLSPFLAIVALVGMAFSGIIMTLVGLGMLIPLLPGLATALAGGGILAYSMPGMRQMGEMNHYLYGKPEESTTAISLGIDAFGSLKELLQTNKDSIFDFFVDPFGNYKKPYSDYEKTVQLKGPIKIEKNYSPTQKAEVKLTFDNLPPNASIEKKDADFPLSFDFVRSTR